MKEADKVTCNCLGNCKCKNKKKINKSVKGFDLTKRFNDFDLKK